MIDIIKSVFTLAVLLMTGVAAVMPAHGDGDDGGDSPSQLRLIDLKNWEPSMQSTLATAGFPAIAASGTEVAVLRSLDAEGNSSVLDVMSVEGKLLKRFPLFPEYGGGFPHSEEARQRLAADIVTPNVYIAEGKFKPVDLLFDHTVEGTPTRTPDWETEVRGLRIRYTYTDSVLEISSLADAKRAVRLHWPLKKLEPMGDGGMIECVNQGKPMKGWTDAAGELIVLYIVHFGGPPHGCDLPEEWRVLRMPH